MASVLITGGKGFIGRHLSMALKKKGYDVAVLSRAKDETSGLKSYYWDISQGIIEDEAIEFADYIIHLAGANISEKKWTENRVNEIFESRVKSAKLLLQKIKELDKKPIAFITASAIGYYGTETTEKIHTEDEPPSEDFLGRICNEWELAAEMIGSYGARVVQLRTGIVLSRTGGALPEMTFPAKFGLATGLGSGRQYMPWIHIDDLCEIYIKAIEDANMNGAYNAVAPEHITNAAFTRCLAKTLKRPNFLPNIPATILKTIYGEMAAILLNGSRVSSEKIREAGYEFLFPGLKEALADLSQISNPMRQNE